MPILMRYLPFMLSMLYFLMNAVPASAAPGWSAAASLQEARYGHTATLLHNGKVLVAGGAASAELYDPAANTWAAAGELATIRVWHTATLLPNGKVLVAGGYNGSHLASAELYDSMSSTWTAAGALATGRTGHTATLLPNGKVLVAGGYNGDYLASAELYDPVANTWTAAGALATGRTGHTATLLPNGKVLVAGGSGIASAELYDPATNTWTAAGALATGRRYHTATLLPNGRVLVAGGWSDSDGNLASTELYDPATNAWAAAVALSTARLWHTATLLPNGEVLVAGGAQDTMTWSPPLYNPLASAELFFDMPPVIEFYNTHLDHYFITADANEAAGIDNGDAGPGWIRTGNSFNSGGNTSVCRFYGSQSPGPNSHFYTADPGECAYLKQLQASTPATEKRWNFESLDFVSTPPSNGACPSGTVPVYRAYNDGFSSGIDSNHRITSSTAAIQEVVSRGWVNEGVVMCAPD